MTFDIVATHGKAGGKLIGTAYNQVAELKNIFPNADIYLMGHDHKRGMIPDSSLYVPSYNHSGAMMVKQSRQWMGRTGSYLRGYVPNTQAYIVGRLLKPSELGHIRFDIAAKRLRLNGSDNLELDITGTA